MERLAQGGRDKLKEDGLNFSDWLQSLASFWGSLYVSYLFSLSMSLGLFFSLILNKFSYTLRRKLKFSMYTCETK